MEEVTIDNEITDALESIGCDHTREPNQLRRTAAVGLDFQPIMVGPHECKAKAIVVRGPHKSAVQRPIEERSVFIVIPVENERIDPVISRRGDLAFHRRGMGLVLVAPERNLRLGVAGKTGARRFDKFPFRPSPTLHRLVARISGVVIAEIVAGYLHFVFLLTNEHCVFANAIRDKRTHLRTLPAIARSRGENPAKCEHDLAGNNPAPLRWA